MNRVLGTVLVLCALPLVAGVGCFVSKGEACTTDGDCGHGDVCTAGACKPKPCTADSDCSKGASACETTKCLATACVVTFTPKGTPLPDDKKGDCQRPACDGKGGTIQVPYPTDVPASTNACLDEACTSAGKPTQSPKAAETTCALSSGNGVCDGTGTCVECVEASDCAGLTGAYCQENACASCSDGKQDGDEAGVDCGGTHCLKCNGDTCSQSADCASNACTVGSSGGKCGWPANVPCMQDDQCASLQCTNGTCTAP